MNRQADQLRYKALARLEAQQYKESLSLLHELVELTDDTLDYAWRAKVHHILGNYEDAIMDLGEILKRDENNRSAIYALALIRCACPHKEHRDGDTALRLAQRLVANNTKPKHTWKTLSVLAAAHAECGNFSEAQEITEDVLKQVPADFVDRFRHRLQQYQKGEPYRSTIQSNIEAFENAAETCVGCGARAYISLTPDRSEFRCVRCASYTVEDHPSKTE